MPEYLEWLFKKIKQTGDFKDVTLIKNENSEWVLTNAFDEYYLEAKTFSNIAKDKYNIDIRIEGDIFDIR